MNMKKKILISFFTAILLLLFIISFPVSSGLDINEKKYAPSSALQSGLPDDEIVTALSEYIKIQTVRGNEKQSALYLKKFLDKEGIESRIIEYPGKPDRANLVAELKGSENKDGVILMNHMDVVEANPAEWTFPPHSGKVENGRIQGRGAVDMKGLGIMQLYAFLYIKRNKIPLKRNIMYLAVADEESRSMHGARFMIEKHRDIFKGYSYMLNEGGVGTLGVAFPGKKVFNIQMAEKGILWLKFFASGVSGHGSTPPPEYAALKMMRFLTKLQEMNDFPLITEDVSRFFYMMGTAAGFPDSFFLKRTKNPIVQQILKPIIRKNRHLTAMTSNTISITSINTDSSSGINVIVPTVTASMDMRLLPGFVPDDVLKKIEALAAQFDVKIEVIHKEAASISDSSGELFQALAAVSKKNVPDITITPFLSPGTTDSGYFREIGIKCYGLIPALMTSEDLDGIHGKNESISIENLKLGTKILYETLVSLN